MNRTGKCLSLFSRLAEEMTRCNNTDRRENDFGVNTDMYIKNAVVSWSFSARRRTRGSLMSSTNIFFTSLPAWCSSPRIYFWVRRYSGRERGIWLSSQRSSRKKFAWELLGGKHKSVICSTLAAIEWEHRLPSSLRFVYQHLSLLPPLRADSCTCILRTQLDLFPCHERSLWHCSFRCCDRSMI